MFILNWYKLDCNIRQSYTVNNNNNNNNNNSNNNNNNSNNNSNNNNKNNNNNNNNLIHRQYFPLLHDALSGRTTLFTSFVNISITCLFLLKSLDALKNLFFNKFKTSHQVYTSDS